MLITEVLANQKNFLKGRSEKIKFVVIHFTANNGDTAENNANYFKNNIVKTSAHYFVDEKSVWQSVKDTDTAWHCGAKKYIHPFCRNANSIGIELCSRKSNGKFYFLKETLENAVVLTRLICEKYNIPIENVLRHYDVTGKICPAPFVEDVKQWHTFKENVEDFMTQETFDKMLDNYFERKAMDSPSEWSEKARKWLEEKKIITGDGQGMRYKSFCTREELAEILYRLKKG